MEAWMSTELSTLMLKVDGTAAQRSLRDFANAANATGVEGTRMGKAYEEAAKNIASQAGGMKSSFKSQQDAMKAAGASTAELTKHQDIYSDNMRNLVKTYDDARVAIEKFQSPQESYKIRLAQINEMLEKGAVDQRTYNAALADAQKELSAIEKHFGAFKMSGKAAFAAVGAAGVASAALLMREVTKTAQSMSAITKEAQKMGVGVAGFNELRYAAEQANIPMGSLTSTLNILNRNIVNNDDKFRSLGISVKDADGVFRSADSVIRDIADRFSDAADGSSKSAAAMDLLGRSGADL
jgi:chromosome segregation ATPase